MRELVPDFWETIPEFLFFLIVTTVYDHLRRVFPLSFFSLMFFFFFISEITENEWKRAKSFLRERIEKKKKKISSGHSSEEKKTFWRSKTSKMLVEKERQFKKVRISDNANGNLWQGYDEGCNIYSNRSTPSGYFIKISLKSQSHPPT